MSLSLFGGVLCKKKGFQKRSQPSRENQNGHNNKGAQTRSLPPLLQQKLLHPSSLSLPFRFSVSKRNSIVTFGMGSPRCPLPQDGCSYEAFLLLRQPALGSTLLRKGSGWINVLFVFHVVALLLLLHSTIGDWLLFQGPGKTHPTRKASPS